MKPRHHRHLLDFLQKNEQPVQPNKIAKELDLKPGAVSQVLAYLYRKGELDRKLVRITPQRVVWFYSLKVKTRMDGVTGSVSPFECCGTNTQPLTDQHSLLTGGLDGSQEASDRFIIWIQTHSADDGSGS